MYKHNLIFILSLFSLLLISCRKETGVIIRGEISSLESPYILATIVSADAFVLDTIVVDNRGRFRYHTAIESEAVVTLYMNQFTHSVVFFANHGDRITVRGDAQMPDIMHITGNATNNELTAFRQENEYLLRERRQLLRSIEDTHQTNSNEVFFSTAQRETLRYNAIKHELSLRAEERIAEYPSNFSSLLLINEFFTDIENPAALGRVLGYIEGEILRSRLARQLQNLYQQIHPVEIGRYTPLFELITTTNDTINSHNRDEKYLLLSFISADGIQSRQMIQSLRDSYTILCADTIQFVSIYMDAEKFPITKVEADSIIWNTVIEEKGWNAPIVDLFNIRTVPFNILIAPNGTIAARNISPNRVVALVSPEKIDPGVVINSIRWATRNVNVPGTFVENPEDFGMFFQWNRRRGWEADGAVTRWNSGNATGTEWTAINDPCPVGWRLPTDTELESLEHTGSVWKMQNGVNGRLFGTAPYQIFLPAAGLRQTTNGARDNVNSSGHYWSSTAGGATRAMGLGFCSGTSGVNHRTRSEGLSVRCVADE